MDSPACRPRADSRIRRRSPARFARRGPLPAAPCRLGLLDLSARWTRLRVGLARTVAFAVDPQRASRGGAPRRLLRPLHRLEPMRERARNGQLLGARLERDHRLVAPVALYARDRVQVDDRRTMDLPERFLVELVVQVLDRLLDQSLRLSRHDLRVLV